MSNRVNETADHPGNAITPEMLEKLCLPSKNPIRSDLRQTFGNPTPVAVLGLCVALSSFSIELMGWRGAGGFSATIGANYFFGGGLLVLSGIAEFILGNTFSCVVFMGYGAHFLTFAATFTPSFAAISSYTTDGSQTQTPAFHASFGFYSLFMCLLSLIFLVCSFRINVVFVLAFASSSFGFGLAAGAFWHLAEGDIQNGNRLLIATGGCFLATAMAGWYLLFAVMTAAVDMPFSVPLFDLSMVIKSNSRRMNQSNMTK